MISRRGVLGVLGSLPFAGWFTQPVHANVAAPDLTLLDLEIGHSYAFSWALAAPRELGRGTVLGRYVQILDVDGAYDVMVEIIRDNGQSIKLYGNDAFAITPL